jgi:Ser/Thr protein kinase RdoA (MazF antagonist)
VTFPITRSYLSVEALARTIYDHYGLTNVRCQLIKAMVCDTYHVVAQTGRFILRVYRHNQRTLDQINAELEIIEHLDANGMIVAPALPQISGSRVLSLDAPEGERYAVLFRFIKGQELSKAPDADTVRKLGATLALAHHWFDTLTLPLPRPLIDIQALLMRPIAAFEGAVQRQEVIAVLREAAARIESQITQLPVRPPAYGLVHGDLIPSNVLVTSAGEIALLDFDFSGWGWRAYDIASFLAEIRFWSMGEALNNIFIEGYESIRPLAADERSSVSVFEVARNVHSFGTPAEHINEWGSVYLSDRLIDSLLKNLQASLTRLS